MERPPLHFIQRRHFRSGSAAGGCWKPRRGVPCGIIPQHREFFAAAIPPCWKHRASGQPWASIV